MTIVVACLLAFALLVIVVEVVRAHRKHLDAMTLMHGDVSHKLEALEAKIDGGTIHK